VGGELGILPRGWVIAVATAMQESSLRNLDHGDRDSLGIMQQRPSMNWGTRAELMRPEYQARKFYERLRAVDGWEEMRLTDAAQRVQRSGTPEAYQRWESGAEQVVAAVSGVARVDLLGGGFPGDPCGLAGAAYTLPPGTWRAPVVATLGSGFRSPGRPMHDGVDLTSPRNTPVHAASNGTVITVVCNASTGNCDVDGNPQVRGCGWYVEIEHAGNVVTRYCHLVRRPEVTVGQPVDGGTVIGYVGTSGNSSGPHLHFEVHVNAPPADSSNAVDPVLFMRRAGGPLGVA
jgi:murein DD-endopeptidase MepM/ murein hydrolase activator NlpD